MANMEGEAGPDAMGLSQIYGVDGIADGLDRMADGCSSLGQVRGAAKRDTGGTSTQSAAQMRLAPSAELRDGLEDAMSGPAEQSKHAEKMEPSAAWVRRHRLEDSIWQVPRRCASSLCCAETGLKSILCSAIRHIALYVVEAYLCVCVCVYVCEFRERWREGLTIKLKRAQVAVMSALLKYMHTCMCVLNWLHASAREQFCNGTYCITISGI
jgi:hypothetical protein